MKNYHGILERKPKAREVTGLILIKRLAFVEKHTGKKDRKENQLCIIDGGQTTPFVEARYKYYEHYVNTRYLIADKDAEMPMKEAESLITELNLIRNYHPEPPEGNEEEVSRANRLAAEKTKQNKERSEEIIKRLSELRSYIRSVDEKLTHHIEAAGDLFEAHISNYWRGVLKASKTGEVTVAPILVSKEYDGRIHYRKSHDVFFEKLENAIALGGGDNEEIIQE